MSDGLPVRVRVLRVGGADDLPLPGGEFHAVLHASPQVESRGPRRGSLGKREVAPLLQPTHLHLDGWLHAPGHSVKLRSSFLNPPTRPTAARESRVPSNNRRLSSCTSRTVTEFTPRSVSARLCCRPR